MSTQKPNVSTYESMESKYGDTVKHKHIHDKGHPDYRGHQYRIESHLHDGGRPLKEAQHSHKTVHENHHYYGSVTIHNHSDNGR